MTMPIVLSIILLICLFILVRNRELERAQQALAIIIAAAIAVTFFVILKSDAIETSFPCDFFFDKETNAPLFFSGIFAYRRRNLGATIWSEFTKRKNWKEELQKLGDGITQQKAIAQNLFEAILLEELLFLYSRHWNIKADTWRTTVSYSSSVHSEIGKEIKPTDVTIYSRARIKEIFKDNIFIEDILLYRNDFKVPKGTRLTVKRDKKKMTTLIQFQHKTFDGNFAASIEFSGNRHWTTGIGSLGELLKISPEEAQKKYASLEVTAILKAKFNPSIFGSSKMKYYKKWIEIMFKKLRNKFDGELLWRETQDEFLFKHIVETKND
ncbi:MAG: hypothetical protein NG740_06090 [Omnitrophica bacterium]|nr:hypothetical protein [Candidatus Omnitrophota bacterium]